MSELLNNININKNKDNMHICYLLINYILDNKISSVEELKIREDLNFSSKDISRKLDICYRDILTDYAHFEEFDQNQMGEFIDYQNLYNKTNDISIKISSIIYLYDMLDWQFLLPYHAYKLIIREL